MVTFLKFCFVIYSVMIALAWSIWFAAVVTKGFAPVEYTWGDVAVVLVVNLIATLVWFLIRWVLDATLTPTESGFVGSSNTGATVMIYGDSGSADGGSADG